MVNAKKTGSRVRMMPESNVSSSQAEPKGCCGFDLDHGDYKDDDDDNNLTYDCYRTNQ